MFRKEQGIYLKPLYDEGDYPIEVNVCDVSGHDGGIYSIQGGLI